ncbi:MAG: Gfo/Idh/MocA family oxidoreductase, partial [bacterium]|nr:Gfo/Idh/MocA family oxidoreductase [bacterium]
MSSIWTEKTMKEAEKLSLLVIGLGSIGKRHVRNLHALGIEDITVVRRANVFPEEPDLPVFAIQTNLDAALERKPDAVIIASPTSLHLEQSIAAARAGCHILVEKPISHSLDGIETLRELVEQNQLVFQTAFQFRFHPVLRQIKELIAQQTIGTIISAHVHWGEYLPAWHPWEDYRQGYSARQDLGGGVVLTLSHPFDYMRWLIGEINSVSAIVAKLSNLEIDVEDTAMITFRFENGAVGSIYLDYIERPSQHRL